MAVVVIAGCTSTTDKDPSAGGAAGSSGRTAATVAAPAPTTPDEVTTSSAAEPTSTPVPTTTTTTTAPVTTTTTTVPPTTTTSPPTTAATSTTTSTTTAPTTTATSTTTTSTTTTSTTTTTTTQPPLDDLVIQLGLADAVVTEAVSDADDGGTSSSADSIGAWASTVGATGSDASEVVATWTIPEFRFVDYGPAPQLNVHFATSITATLDTDNWSGTGARLSVAAEARLGGASVAEAEAVLAQIGRHRLTSLIAEEHVTEFGVPIDLTSASGALVIEFRVSCDVDSTDNPFGLFATSSCAAGAAFDEAYVTVRPGR